MSRAIPPEMGATQMARFGGRVCIGFKGRHGRETLRMQSCHVFAAQTNGDIATWTGRRYRRGTQKGLRTERQATGGLLTCNVAATPAEFLTRGRGEHRDAEASMILPTTEIDRINRQTQGRSTLADGGDGRDQTFEMRTHARGEVQ